MAGFGSGGRRPQRVARSAWSRGPRAHLRLGMCLLLTTFAVGACVHRPGPIAASRPQRTHSYLGKTCGAPISLTAPQSLPDSEREWVGALLPQACERLARFSLQLRLPTEIRLYATPNDFRNSTHKRASWLRAWAGYRVVHLIPPSHWQTDTREIRIARLAHELTHVALFQHFASEADASEKSIPLWFIEGAASVCAQQGARRMPLDEVCRLSAGQIPLTEPATWRRNHHLLYGAAHAAVAALVAHQGNDIVTRTLRTYASKAAEPFEQTLQQLTGFSSTSLWRSLCSDENATSEFP